MQFSYILRKKFIQTYVIGHITVIFIIWLNFLKHQKNSSTAKTEKFLMKSKFQIKKIRLKNVFSTQQSDFVTNIIILYKNLLWFKIYRKTGCVAEFLRDLIAKKLPLSKFCSFVLVITCQMARFLNELSP